MEAMRRTGSGEADPPFTMFVARTAFRLHAALYAAVNVALAVVNLTLFPKVLFFPWPLVGWGIGLAMHYLLGVRWADRTRPRTAERGLRRPRRERSAISSERQWRRPPKRTVAARTSGGRSASRRYRHLHLVQEPRP
jgi:hypothetical protein